MKKTILKILLILTIILPLNVYAQNRVINGNDFAIYNRTKADIYNKWRIGKIDQEVPIYVSEPSYTAPYKAGVVTTDYLDEVLDNLNYYRYLVGVPEITIRTTNDEALQKAEVIQTLYAEENYALTHDLPKDFTKPDDMNDDFWGSKEECERKENPQCYGAYANHNIISYGRPDEPNFYFFDESKFDEEYQEAGHRMALLSPEVVQEDYGIGERVIYGRSTLSSSNYNRMTNEFAAYPSPGYFPKEDFADISDWDIFLNIYEFKFLTATEQQNVKVTIKNLGTGLVETRSLAEKNLNFDYECKETLCTIWNRMNILQPTKESEYYEDSYEVTVENLIDKSGNPVDLKYTVEFYDRLEGTTSNITAVNPFLKGMYYDGEYDKSLLDSALDGLFYGLDLDSNESVTYAPASHQINKYGTAGYGTEIYHAFPSLDELPSYIVDNNNLLKNEYLTIQGNNVDSTYKYTYDSATYNANIGDNVTIRVNSLETGLNGYFYSTWIKYSNGEFKELDDQVKYGNENNNTLTLTINSVTADDADKYYIAALLVVPTNEENPELYYYISKPLTLTVNTPAESIAFDSESMTIHAGDTEKLDLTITPTTANPNLTWQSSDNTIVSVDDEGNITGKKVGTATITVTDGNLSAAITVNVTSYLKGDLNKNNKIDLPDVIHLLKRYLNVVETTAEDITIGDMNEDGSIGLADIILLLRIYLGVN